MISDQKGFPVICRTAPVRSNSSHFKYEGPDSSDAIRLFVIVLPNVVWHLGDKLGRLAGNYVDSFLKIGASVGIAQVDVMRARP